MHLVMLFVYYIYYTYMLIIKMRYLIMHEKVKELNLPFESDEKFVLRKLGGFH